MSKIGFPGSPSNGREHNWTGRRRRRKFTFNSSGNRWNIASGRRTNTGPIIDNAVDVTEFNDATGLVKGFRGIAKTVPAFDNLPTGTDDPPIELKKGDFYFVTGANELYMWTGDNVDGPTNALDISDTDLLNGIAGSPTLSSNFAGDIRIDTNGTYSIVSDNYFDPEHNGDTITNAGWAWIVRNSDGAIMKSWNSMLDGDAPDDASLATETNSDTGASSKYLLAGFGWACAINDNYAFVGAVYRPLGGVWSNNNWAAGRGYVFAISLSDFTVAHVFEVPAGLNSTGIGSSSGGTGWIEQGIVATNDTLVISANAHDKYNNGNNTGAITVHDISDPTPSNWTTTIIESPIDTRTEPTWLSPSGSTFGNTNFGASVDIVGDKIAVAHTHWLHVIEKTNNTWSITNSTREVYQQQHGASPRSFLTADGNTWVRMDTDANSFIAFDLTNNLAQLYTKTGVNGGNLHRDGNYIYSGDGGYDDTVTNQGAVYIYNVSDASDVTSIANPTPANINFGSEFRIKNSKLVSRIRPNGTGYGLVFMDLSRIV